MTYSLPVSVTVGGAEYEIRSDYRAALDICAALSDTELSDTEKAEVTLRIFYPEWREIPPEEYINALNAAFDFLSYGEERTQKKPRLMDWQQDFKYIAPAINRVLGKEIRSEDYLHWWTFLGAYYEIGECLFSQIVGIRSKKSRGKKLEKHEQEWYRSNRDIVDLKHKYTETEQQALRALGLK